MKTGSLQCGWHQHIVLFSIISRYILLLNFNDFMSVITVSCSSLYTDPSANTQDLLRRLLVVQLKTIQIKTIQNVIFVDNLKSSISFLYRLPERLMSL